MARVAVLFSSLIIACYSKRWQRSAFSNSQIRTREPWSGDGRHAQTTLHDKDPLRRLSTLLFSAAVPPATLPTRLPLRRAREPSMASRDVTEDDTSTKQPWEWRRFLRTVGFYGGLRPRIPVVSKVISKISRQGRTQALEPQETIWSIKNPHDVAWGPLDDVVMGGASRSDLEPGQTFAGKWTGTVTTANNGGFVGIRTKPFQVPLDLSKCRGLMLMVKGDGQRYKFILRDDENWNGITWSYSFQTDASTPLLEIIKIPFSGFVATKYARTISGKQLKTESITAMQFALSKFEYDELLNSNFKEGPFELTVNSIQVY